MALEPQRDDDIRKSALVSLSFVAGRARERGRPLADPAIIGSLIQQSQDSIPIIRQTAAFALGLFESPEATHQLEVLLENPDRMTAINAAIGLARSGSTKGFAVMKESLSASPTASDPKGSEAEGEQFRILKNVLKAVNELSPKFDAAQKQELIPLVESLASHHPEIRIRVDAEAALKSLKSEDK